METDHIKAFQAISSGKIEDVALYEMTHLE